MFLNQTVKEYLDNPMGKGSTAITNRTAIQASLNFRYEDLVKKNKGLDHKLFRYNDTFYIHVKIPSESKRENTYDVVIMLSSLDEKFSTDINLNRYFMSVFSNCPSFVYTFAYVYNKYDMLIPELKDKYEHVTLESEPKIKNPAEIINYDKSIYFACKYITEHKLLMSKIAFPQMRPNAISNYFKNNIRSTSTIMREIDQEKARIYEEKKKEQRENIEKLNSAVKKSKSISNKKSSVKKITGQKSSTVNKIKPKSKIKPR